MSNSVFDMTDKLDVNRLIVIEGQHFEDNTRKDVQSKGKLDITNEFSLS